MKLLGFSVKNYRKIKAFEMTLGGNGLYKIKGANGQGKTSAVKAVEFLLAGKRGSVHEGADRATVIGHIKDGGQEWTIERELTPDNKMSLRVHGSQTGKRDKAPQAFLDALINELTFDPRPFVNKTPTERVKMYTEIMGLDFSDENKRISHLYEVRRSVGRKIKDIGNPEIPYELQTLEVPDLSTIQEERELRTKIFNRELEAVVAFNAAQDAGQAKLDKMNAQLDVLMIQRDETAARIWKIRKELEDLEAEAKTIEDRIDKGTVIIHEFDRPQPKKPLPVLDLSDINEKLSTFEEINKKIEERKQYDAKIEKKNELSAEYAELDADIDAIRRSKLEKAALVDSPVNGLELRICEDGEELYYNNRPSDDWAESEALRISAELCAAKHPDLRCVFIDGGESYDKKALESLHEWATTNDIQAIITIVDDLDDATDLDDDSTFWIEDGELHAI